MQYFVRSLEATALGLTFLGFWVAVSGAGLPILA